MLKLKHVKTYYGANPYIDKKAMIFEVEHDLKLNQSNIKRRLIEINDELPIDFDPFDLSEATSHINYISHLALQLLNYIRGDLRFSFTKNGKIIIDFHNPKVNFFVFDEISKWFSLDAFDIDEFQIDLQNIWNVCKAKHPDFQAHALIQGCEDLGLSFLSLGQKKWLYGLGSGSKIFYETSPLDDFNLPKFSKLYSKSIFERVGAQTAPYVVLAKNTDLTIVEKKIGYKCVVKPLNGGQGRGLTSNISNCLELKHAVHKAFEESKVDEPIIVEKHVDGYDYRLLFINGIHVGCVERGYPFVVGNGRSTVRELIEDHNKNRTISVYKSIFRRPVKIDSEVSRCLEANNLDFGSIPDDGVKVYLRSTQNASSGGTVRRVDNVHPKVLAKATEVASASGAYSIGVDYISHDISANPRITSGVFTEINKTPGVPAFIASGSDPAEIGKLFLGSGCYNVPVNIFISDSKNLKETLKAMGLKEVFISPNYIFKNGKIYKLPSRYYLENLAIYSKNRKLNELSIIIFSEYITQIGIPEHTSSIFINSCVDVSVRSFVEESGFSFQLID